MRKTLAHLVAQVVESVEDLLEAVHIKPLQVGHPKIQGVTWPSRLTGFKRLGDSIFSRENKFKLLFQGPLAK